MDSRLSGRASLEEAAGSAHGLGQGRILFEVDGVSVAVAREALGLAAAKLPIKTRFIERIAE
jgi:ribosomal protein L16/L10AE